MSLQQKNQGRNKTHEAENTTDRQSFIRQFPKNLVSNLLLFLLKVVIGIWLVPYYIKNLSVAAYGLIPLATSLTHYVALVTIVISGGISRFLTIDLQRKDFDQANRTFNTSLWSLTVIIIAFVPLLALFTYLVPQLFVIPPGQLSSARWLFAGVTGSFLITALSSCFGASAFAHNRLDLRNFTSIVRLTAQALLLVILFNLLHPSLEKVALATIFAALASFCLDFYFWCRLTPELKINPSFFDKNRVKVLTSMGGWLLVNQVGYLLFLQIDLIVVNRVFGPTAGGEYASVLQWSMLLRSMAGILSGVVQPMFLICYAKTDKATLIRIAKMSVKFMGLGLALPIGLACGFAPGLLTAWLGPNFSPLAPLMVLMLIHLPVNLAVTPLFAINVSYNKVKLPGIVTLLMGALNLALALLIPSVFKTGFYGIALAGAIVLTLKNGLFTPWYATRVMGIQTQTFFKEILAGMTATLIVYGFSSFAMHFCIISSWSHLFFAGILLTVIYLPIIWSIGLTMDEKRLISSMSRRGNHEKP